MFFFSRFVSQFTGISHIIFAFSFRNLPFRISEITHNRLRQHGAVVRVLLIDGSEAVMSQGCCRSTAARRCCRCCHEIGTPLQGRLMSANNVFFICTYCLKFFATLYLCKQVKTTAVYMYTFCCSRCLYHYLDSETSTEPALSGSDPLSESKIRRPAIILIFPPRNFIINNCYSAAKIKIHFAPFRPPNFWRVVSS